MIICGAAIIITGGYYAYKGASRRFLQDLTAPAGRVITALGFCGYLAEGLVLCGAGILVVVASVDMDPSKAAGIDAAVKTIGATPLGRVLLIFAALGFGAYGLYSFALTRYARM